MKKNLRFMVFALMAVFTFTLVSCSSDEDDNSSTNPLIGTWYTEYEVEESVKHYEEITYKADNTCTWKEIDYDRTYTDLGKYSVEGNKISIWWESEKDLWEKEGPFVMTFTISGNKMTTTKGSGSRVTTWTKK